MIENPRRMDLWMDQCMLIILLYPPHFGRDNNRQVIKMLDIINSDKQINPMSTIYLPYLKQQPRVQYILSKYGPGIDIV